VYGIFNVRTDVDACDCTQESALKVDWEKSTLPYLGDEPASKLRLAFQKKISFCINIQRIRDNICMFFTFLDHLAASLDSPLSPLMSNVFALLRC